MVGKINQRLNMVIPIYSESNPDKDAKPSAYVHSTPISSEVFDKYWEPIGLSFARLYNGLGVTAGVRVADKMLRKVAIEINAWEGADGVRNGLVPEIQRLTNVLSVGKHGWELIPLNDAVRAGTLSAEDAALVEAAIVFFTVVSSMHRKAELQISMGLASALWGALLESSGCTEFLNSLRTSTARENTGVMAVVS